MFLVITTTFQTVSPMEIVTV